MEADLCPSSRGVGSNCGVLGGVLIAPGRSGASIRGFGLGRGGGCGEGALTGREPIVSIQKHILTGVLCTIKASTGSILFVETLFSLLRTWSQSILGRSFFRATFYFTGSELFKAGFE